MDQLETIRFYQIDSTPQPPREPGAQDPIPAQLFSAITAAHAEFRTGDGDRALLVSAWQRRPGDPRMRILLGGSPYLPAVGAEAHSADKTVPVLYPPGSQGRALTTTEVLADWHQYAHWVHCHGEPDPLWTPQESTSAPAPRRGGFDDYVTHFRDPFIWLVLARPRPLKLVEDELQHLQFKIPGLRANEADEQSRIELQRSQGRYRELSRAVASGMWDLTVLVGALTAPVAQRAAALLCSASDLDDLPYILTPAQQTCPPALALASRATATAASFAASAEMLAALARPPRRELPGIRLIEAPDFDVTPEHIGEIDLGEILDVANQPAGQFTVTSQTINRHTFVAGATGSGKSQTVRHLLEQLHNAGVSWLVIESAKAEYARMAGRIGADQVAVIRPGDPDAIPVSLNPLEPEPGFPLQTHIDLVRALFLAAFEATEPFPQVLSHALTRCYTDRGWDPVLSTPARPGTGLTYPSLGDLQQTARQVVGNIGYGKEITDNVRGFIDVRIGSLRQGAPGRFFEGGHPLDVTDLLGRNVVLEIEDIGSDQDKAFVIGAVLIRLYEHLRVHRVEAEGTVPLQHVTVIEEAHRLLKRVEPGSPAAHAVALFTSLLAEIRAYGEGIIVAEQIPSKIVPDVIKNTALKIVHRLPAADDREAVGATMNLDDAQSRHIVSLPPGRAAAFTDGMDRPIRIAVPFGETREGTAERIPVAIRRSRSAACGPECSTKPCALREMNLASTFADDPRLILWIELLTIAHLVGKPAPRPDKTWLDDLAGRADRRTVECAISHRVQAAIDNRYSGLTQYYQPESLAQHLATAALSTVDAAAPPCDGTEVCWQAGRYRWSDVFRALRAPDVPVSAPHPDTASWTDRGLFLSGTTTEQLAQLREHPDTWLPTRSTITGTAVPPSYETAAARLSKAGSSADRFLAATAFLGFRTTWPLFALGLSDGTEDAR
ncbi:MULTISPECIES: ATP-binding protein [unclassified Crossiella]|uniref:ATP-binding protein n=1 Tax=unclassified Crossiella TaxID=2620835 RepID=UPI002000083A|nr:MULTISPECIES: helicase HerA-like domain-containing protein [unclassified Crossiella]MCK2243653.1 DUF853 family protein [Crossiella sp. S99.2]MCK2257511.1 DUF853 family protein [Crossiella sp. S99.1]